MYTCAPASATANWWTSFDKSEVKKSQARAKYRKEAHKKLLSPPSNRLKIYFTNSVRTHAFSWIAYFQQYSYVRYGREQHSYTVHGSLREYEHDCLFFVFNTMKRFAYKVRSLSISIWNQLVHLISCEWNIIYWKPQQQLHRKKYDAFHSR